MGSHRDCVEECGIITVQQAQEGRFDELERMKKEVNIFFGSVNDAIKKEIVLQGRKRTSIQLPKDWGTDSFAFRYLKKKIQAAGWRVAYSAGRNNETGGVMISAPDDFQVECTREESCPSSRG